MQDSLYQKTINMFTTQINHQMKTIIFFCHNGNSIQIIMNIN